MFCPNCGNQIADEFTFCPYCGKQVPRVQSDGSGEYRGENNGQYTYGFGQNFDQYRQYTAPKTGKYPGRGLGIASMVLGICAIIYTASIPLGIVLSVISIVFGAVSMSRGREVGKTNAFGIAGIACSCVSICFTLLIIAILGSWISCFL